MEYNRKMEVFSNVVKQEVLFPLEEKISSGSLVFESLDPFPGYYHETPDSSPPLYLYLALDRQYRFEEILRAIQEVTPLTSEGFDACKAIITIAGEEIPAIRLRHFGGFDCVAPLQEAFKNHGLGYLRKSKRQGEYPSFVRIVKMLYLKQVEPHVYIDLKEDYHGYIGIPRYLSWELFESVTSRVKYNWMGSKFDTACGSFFSEGRLYEFVRVYSDKLDSGYLQDIRSLYLEELSHPLS
jgi:hypothetical protein